VRLAKQSSRAGVCIIIQPLIFSTICPDPPDADPLSRRPRPTKPPTLSGDDVVDLRTVSGHRSGRRRRRPPLAGVCCWRRNPKGRRARAQQPAVRGSLQGTGGAPVILGPDDGAAARMAASSLSSQKLR
jgi:hypothetical protein